MFRLRLRPLFLLIYFLFLAACTPTTESAADPIVVTERPTLTITATYMPSSTLPAATNTPQPAPTASPTSKPTSTMPVLPTPHLSQPSQQSTPTLHLSQPSQQSTPTPHLSPTPQPSTPTPQSLYEDIWVGGFLMSHAEMQAGNSDIYNLIGLIGGNMFIPLQTADSETEAQLSSLPVGDVLVLVEGDFYYNGPEAYWLVIKEINQVNLPYTPETPLDATYTHNDPVFSFNYPSGWFVVPVENETEAILYLHNVPPTHDLRVGRERRDPTRFDFTISLREATSVETYVNERTTDELSSFCIEDVTTLNINGRSVTRIRFDKGCLGRTVEYIFSLNEQVFSISSNAQHAPFFIERVLATLR